MFQHSPASGQLPMGLCVVGVWGNRGGGCGASVHARRLDSVEMVVGGVFDIVLSELFSLQWGGLRHVQEVNLHDNHKQGCGR